MAGGNIDLRYNARTHGAQSRPSEAEILAHLEVILGEGASDMRLDPSDPVTFAALELADREARLDAAQPSWLSLRVKIQFSRNERFLTHELYCGWVKLIWARSFHFKQARH